MNKKFVIYAIYICYKFVKNNDDKCFQYAVTLALNLDKIKRGSQRISKIKPFIDQYNWKHIFSAY